VDVESIESFERVLNLQNGTQSAADMALAVRFFLDEVPDPVETAKMGRPIFKTVEMCEIRIPGDKDNVIIDRVKSMHPDPRERFPLAYAKYKAKHKDQVVGTLLREWGLIPRSDALAYEAIGVQTVEQLAGISDTNAASAHVTVAHRQIAKDFLATAAGQAPMTQARADLEAARLEIQGLRDELDALKARVGPVASVPAPIKLIEPAPIPTGKRRGRPPKVKPEPITEG
jgi:hypothetical protein